MRERIKPDNTGILNSNKKYTEATQKFKDGEITKDQFINTINAHQNHITMTLDEFKKLPIMENYTEVVSHVKMNRQQHQKY